MIAAGFIPRTKAKPPSRNSVTSAQTISVKEQVSELNVSGHTTVAFAETQTQEHFLETQHANNNHAPFSYMRSVISTQRSQ